jgi:hypothetical protein
MINIEDKYSFGKCAICGRDTALKNGRCNKCDDDGSAFIKFFEGIVKNESNNRKDN